jgi:hypothetical protein
LTTAATYLARQEKLDPPLTGSILMCTGMPHEASDRRGNHINLYPRRCPSWEEHAEAPISSRRTNQRYAGTLISPSLVSLLTCQILPTQTYCPRCSHHAMCRTRRVCLRFTTKSPVSIHGETAHSSIPTCSSKLESRPRLMCFPECLIVGGRFIRSYQSTKFGFEKRLQVRRGSWGHSVVIEGVLIFSRISLLR